MMEANDGGDDWYVSNPYFAFVEFRKQAVIINACKAVGSVRNSCFDIRFNPDVCSPGRDTLCTDTVHILYMYTHTCIIYKV